MANQKLSPTDSARIHRMKADGCSLAEIASALNGKVTRQTVAAHLKLATPMPISREKTKKKPTPPSKPVKKGAKKAKAKAPVEEEEDPALEDLAIDEKIAAGAQLSVEALIVMFERTKTAIDQIDPTVKHQAFIALGKFMQDLGAKIHALLPPVPVDPANDPANILAREELTKRFTSMVEAKEAAAKRAAAALTLSA